MLTPCSSEPSFLAATASVRDCRWLRSILHKPLLEVLRTIEGNDPSRSFESKMFLVTAPDPAYNVVTISRARRPGAPLRSCPAGVAGSGFLPLQGLQVPAWCVVAEPYFTVPTSWAPRSAATALLAAQRLPSGKPLPLHTLVM